MIQLLNRIAWLASISIGVLIAALSGGDIEFIVAGVGIGAIIKGLFLSRHYIETRVEHFTTVALQRKDIIPLEKDSVNKTLDQTEVSPIEDITQDVREPTEEEIDSLKQMPKIYESKEAHIEGEEIELLNKTGEVFRRFFSENILAKIGGILVFLGVLFLLSLVWSAIPGVLKLIIGFIIGMLTYFAGVRLDKKGLPNEGRILLGVGILINYAVILSGRYIIGETSLDSTPIFSIGLSFFFLILNTIFAVLTSLYYKSDTLLVFAFLFAYANPFLIGLQESTPYLQVGYTLIVSLGALFLAKQKSNIFLVFIAFIFGNLLLYTASNSSGNIETGYMLKYISIIGLSLVSLLSAIKMDFKQKGIIEILFGASFFAVGLFGLIGGMYDLGSFSYILTIIAAFVFMGFSFFYMQKWPYLYAIGSIAGAIILSSHMSWSEAGFLFYNILAVLLYMLVNIGGALALKIDNESKLKNLVLGSVSGVLFVGLSVYSYSMAHSKSFIFMGFALLLIAILYFIISYVLVQKLGYKAVRDESLKKNTIYNFLAISISLLSLAIALVFSEYDFIVSLFWLIESAILFFFYSKVKDSKIIFAGLILMLLGIMGWYSEVGNVSGLLAYIAPATLMFGILVFNTIQLKNEKREGLGRIHDIFHILGIIGIITGISLALKGTSESVFIFSIAVFLVGLSYFYKLYGSSMLKKWFMVLGIFIMCSHVATYLNEIYRGDMDFMSTLFQYTISIFFVIMAGIQFFPKETQKAPEQSLALFSLIYLFIMSTLYVYHIFPNTFAVTLYWGILAFILISRGINKDIIALRTLGLYLVSLVCFKILFIDITTGISNTIIKVFAFIAVGVMFIVIGTMYSRKYGNKLKGEFDLSNIIGSKETSELKDKGVDESISNDTPESFNSVIDSINIDNISSVTFKPNGSKSFTTKSRNLIKIVKGVMGMKKQATYKPGELLGDYNYIIKNYKSSLNKTELGRVQNAIKDFVDAGGEVIIK